MLMGGLLQVWRHARSPGVAFSGETFMMIVPDAVICGVTFSVGARR